MKDKTESIHSNEVLYVAEGTEVQGYERLCNRLRSKEIGYLEFRQGIKLLYCTLDTFIGENDIRELANEILKE